MKSIYIFAFSLLVLILGSCSNESDQLPILGPREAVNVTIEGKTKVDTLYHTIPDFKFVDQDGDTIDQVTFYNKVYVADFFFTTCPTICPVMKSNLLKVYEKYLNNDEVGILSHTIDPGHDSVSVLKDYSNRMQVNSYKWHFVTGNRDSIFSMAKSYMVSALEDKNSPGGYAHSGALVLIDKQKRIRGYYDGTKEEATNKLIADIGKLLHEK